MGDFQAIASLKIPQYLADIFFGIELLYIYDLLEVSIFLNLIWIFEQNIKQSDA